MLPKPQLRGLLKSQLQRHFAIACGLMFLTTTSFRVFYKTKHEEKYAEYYKNLDVNKEFLIMRDLGIFQSVKPGGVIPEQD